MEERGNRRSFLPLPAALAVGVLFLGSVLHFGVVVPLRREWYAAQAKTYDTALELMTHGGARPTGEMVGRTAAALEGGVFRRQLDCFPSKYQWFRARLHQTAEEVEASALNHHRTCLERAIEQEASRARGWSPPKPGGV